MDLLAPAPISCLLALILAIAFLLFQPTGLVKWLQKKNYQYEVTFALYMLTPTEKFIFSTFEPSSNILQILTLPVHHVQLVSRADMIYLQTPSSSSPSPCSR